MGLNTGEARVTYVKRIWTAYANGGVEAIRDLVDDDVVWLPYGAGGEVLRGVDELVRYLASRQDRVEADTYSFEAHEESVLVTGHLRLRAGVSLTDTQLYWVYHFRGMRIVRLEAYTDRQAALDSVNSGEGGIRTREGV